MQVSLLLDLKLRPKLEEGARKRISQSHFLKMEELRLDYTVHELVITGRDLFR